MAQFLRPVSDRQIAGAWVKESGAVSLLYQAIDETVASDADYIQSPSKPDSTMFYDVSLSTAQIPQAGAHTLRYRLGKGSTAGQQVNFTVSLRRSSDNVVIATFTHVDIGTATTYTQVLTAGQIANINYGTGTYIHFDGTSVGGGQPREARIYWAELEIPDSPPPTQVTDLAASNVTLNTASLNWTPGSNIQSQEVYASMNGGTYSLRATLTVGATTYAYTTGQSAPNGKYDQVFIRSVGFAGQTINGNIITINYPALGTPVVTASNITETSVVLSWSALTYASQYQIYRNGAYRTATSSLTNTQTGMVKLTEYTFEVRALFNNSTDTTSGFVTITTGGAIPLKIEISEVWKEVETAKILIGGVWKNVDGIKQLVGGVWKNIF